MIEAGQGLYAKALQRLREEFLPSQKGKTFTSDDVYRFFQIDRKPNAVEAKKALGLVLYNLSQVNKKPELEQHGKTYRIIDRTLNLIEWWKAVKGDTLKIKYPRGVEDGSSFGFEDSILIYPKDLIVIAGEGNTAKALRNGTPVLTPTGWVSIEELKEGDLVYASNGETTQVLGVFPQGQHQCYRFIFNDDTWIDSDQEHLWVVQTPYAREHKTTGHNNPSKAYHQWQQRTTGQIVKQSGLGAIPDNKRMSIPTVKPVEFPFREIPIDPYLLGLLLGDGCFVNTSMSISTADREILDAFKNNGFTWKPISKYDFRIQGLSAVIRKLGLLNLHSHEKFVPPSYKWNGSNERLALLQGLLDTDGTVDKRNSWVVYCTTSPQLAEDVVFLVRSLGGRCRSTSSTPHFRSNGERRNGRLAYRVHIKMPVCPFRLNRKSQLWRVARKTLNRIMYQIQDIGVQETTCIKIADPIGLFVTKDFILTHNTAWCLNFMVENMGIYPCYYFTSEFNAPKFLDRMGHFDWVNVYKEDGTPKFTLAEQAEHWQDVIQPNAFNIVDWVYLDDEMWKIRTLMKQIIAPLDRGIAVVVIQKRSYKQVGEGGEGTKDLASVYFTIRNDKELKRPVLKVEKVKTPNTGRDEEGNTIINPNFREWSFQVVQSGSKFHQIAPLNK